MATVQRNSPIFESTDEDGKHMLNRIPTLAPASAAGAMMAVHLGGVFLPGVPMIVWAVGALVTAGLLSLLGDFKIVLAVLNLVTVPAMVKFKVPGYERIETIDHEVFNIIALICVITFVLAISSWAYARRVASGRTLYVRLPAWWGTSNVLVAGDPTSRTNPKSTEKDE